MFKVKVFIGDEYDGDYEVLEVYSTIVEGDNIKFLVYHNRRWRLLDSDECTPVR